MTDRCSAYRTQPRRRRKVAVILRYNLKVWRAGQSLYDKIENLCLKVDGDINVIDVHGLSTEQVGFDLVEPLEAIKKADK